MSGKSSATSLSGGGSLSTPRSSKLYENLSRKSLSSPNSVYRSNLRTTADTLTRRKYRSSNERNINTHSKISTKLKNPYGERSPREWSGSEMEMYGSFAT